MKQSLTQRTMALYERTCQTQPSAGEGRMNQIPRSVIAAGIEATAERSAIPVPQYPLLVVLRKGGCTSRYFTVSGSAAGSFVDIATRSAVYGPSGGTGPAATTASRWLTTTTRLPTLTSQLPRRSASRATNSNFSAASVPNRCRFTRRYRRRSRLRKFMHNDDYRPNRLQHSWFNCSTPSQGAVLRIR